MPKKTWNGKSPKRPSASKYGDIPVISLEGDTSSIRDSVELIEDPFGDDSSYDDRLSSNNDNDNDNDDENEEINRGRKLLSVPFQASTTSRNSLSGYSTPSRRRSGSSSNSRSRSSFSGDADNALFDALAEDDTDAIMTLKDDIRTAIGGKNSSGVWLQPQHTGRSNRSSDRSRSPVGRFSSERYSSDRFSNDIELGHLDIPRIIVEDTSSNKKSDFTESTRELSRESTLPVASSSKQNSLLKKIKSKVSTIRIHFPDDIPHVGSSSDAYIEKQGNYESAFNSNLPIPKKAKLYGNSLGVFSPTNSYRIACAQFLQNSLFVQLMKLILLLQTALLAYRQWNPRFLDGYIVYGMNWADWVLVALNIFYTFELFANVIAWGFWDDSEMFDENNWCYVSFYELSGLKSLKHYFFGKREAADDLSIQRNIKNTLTMKTTEEFYGNEIHRAYLRKTWNRIDFVSTVSFWISFFLSIHRTDVEAGVPVFRALSCLRILKITTFLNRVSLILSSIKLGLPQLIDVFLFLLYFWCFFAIIGIQSFKSSLRRFCVWTNPDDPTETYTSEQYCGGYYTMVNGTLTTVPYIKQGIHAGRAKGFLCPVNSQCVTLTNANGNTYGFDNILSSMQMTFVVMSGNTFSNIMYDTMDTDSMAASLFFICGIFFLLLWMINLVIAVISESFKVVMEEYNTSESPDIVSNDFQLDWKFTKSIYSKIYTDLKICFDLLILISVIYMCFRDMETTAAELTKARRAEGIISLVLLFEMVIRFTLYLPNWRTFFTLKRNLLDLFLAIITSIMGIPIIYEKSDRLYEWFLIFFLMRLYRIVILVKFTRRLWAKVWKNISIIFNLSLFYFVILFLVSIIFARYFEDFADEDSIDQLDFPFHTLPNVFLGLFVVTSTENWSDLMFNLEALAPNKSATFFAVILFIGWFLLSNSIILNIFIAIIGSSLDITEAQKRKEQVKKFVLVDFPNRLKALTEDSVLIGLRSRLFLKKDKKEDRHQEIQKLLLNGAAVQAFLKDELAQLESSHTKGETEEEELLDNDSIHQLQRSTLSRYFQIQFRRFIKNKFVAKAIRILFWNDLNKNPFYKNNYNGIGNITDENFTSLAERYRFETNKTSEERKAFLKKNPSFNTSLYILHPKQPLRRACQLVTYSSYGQRYDGVEPNKIANLIFTCIITIATLLLIVIACYNTPLYKQQNGSLDWNWTFYIELAFAVMFLFEFFIKIIADGLLLTPNGYLKNIWNIIDFIVLISIWINVIAIARNDETLSRIVRGLKALRALRLLTINETSRNIFQKVMVAGFFKILGAAFLAFSLLFPFSVWGLNLFTGRLGVCNDGNLGSSDCVHEYSNEVFNWDVLSPRAYGEPQLEFNRFASALLTAFEIISLEGWTDLLSNLVNSTGIGTPAESYASPENAIFMVVFMFIGLILILTLFVSVIINNYSSLTGSAFLTLQQTSWLEVRKLLGQIKPRTRPIKVNLNRFRTFCFKYCVDKNKYVTSGYQILLWIHILAILLEQYPSNHSLDNFRYSIYFISSVLFLTFTSLKLIALGPRIYFHVRWNAYEFFIFLGAFSTSLASFFVSRSTVFSNINKLFLVGIFTVLIHISNRLSHLLKIVSASIPSLLLLIFTWFVLFLVYAIAMNQIFGLTRLGPNTSDNINFRTVPKALILLFKNSFGEGWNYVMKDFAVESPYCVASSDYVSTDCGNEIYAYILFISWNIISMYIFVNMFISLIFESFSYVYANNADTTSLNREEIRNYKKVWQMFDPLGTGYIQSHDLPLFLRTLDGYFSFKVFDGRWTIPELTKKFKKYPDIIPSSPYYMFMDMKGLNNQLNKLDVEKVKVKKMAYDRLIEEAHLNMELYNEPGISFHRLILQIPLYARFDESNCLTLTDFLDRLIITRKVNRRLHYRHHIAIFSMIMFRWRFLKSKRPGKVLEYKANKEPLYTERVFDTPIFNKSKGSFESFGTGVNPISTEETYWSPTRTSRYFSKEDAENDLDNDLDNDHLSIGALAEGLENSQWVGEIKSTNDDFEQFLETSKKLQKKFSKGDEKKDDSDNDTSSNVSDGRKLA